MATDYLPEGMPTVGVPLFDSDTPAPAAPVAPAAPARTGGGGFPAHLAPLGNYWADYYGLDRNIFSAMIHQESGYDHMKPGGSGELGLGQLMPDTARGLGLVVNKQVDERADPNRNLMASAQYLRQQLDDPRVNGDYRKALMLYNSGPNPKVPFRNTNYANAVMGRVGADVSQVQPVQMASATPTVGGPYLTGDPVPDSPFGVGGRLAFAPPRPAVQFTGPTAPVSAGGGGGVAPVNVSPEPGAGGPSGQSRDDRAREIANQFAQGNEQGRGFQMLSLMAAMLRGWPVRQAYPVDPASLVPRHMPGTGDAPMGIGLGANTPQLGMVPWEEYGFRRRDVPR